MSIAVAYLRKSSAPSKRTRTVSFEIQEQETRALAVRNGDELVEVLSDWGKSGGTVRRPDYQRLLAMIEAGEVRTVYSFSLSRLSRSLVDFADLMERCRAHSVRIQLVQEGSIDWSTATGRMYATLVATFAQFERELAAERNSAAAAERRERGDHLGQAPYGYSVVDGKLVRREDEDPGLVAQAFREAGSFAGAARLLNEWGVPTRRRTQQNPKVGLQEVRWNHTVVSDILRAQGPADLRLAIVQKRPRAKALPNAIFSGLLACPCGALLTPRRDHDSRRQGRPSGPTGTAGYYCSRSYRSPHTRMYAAEPALLEWARAEAARLQVPGERVRIAREAEAELAALEGRRTRVLDAYVDGALGKSERDERLATLEAERARLQARSASVAIPSIDWQATPSSLNAVLRALWARIELDEHLRPVEAEWRIPEWRAA